MSTQLILGKEVSMDYLNYYEFAKDVLKSANFKLAIYKYILNHHWDIFCSQWVSIAASLIGRE